MIHQDYFDRLDSQYDEYGYEYDEIVIPDSVLYKMEADYDWPDAKAPYLETVLIDTAYVSIHDRVRARFPSLFYKLSNRQLDMIWEWLWIESK